MPSVLRTTTSPRRGLRVRNVIPSIMTWSPPETAGAIAPVGTENGRSKLHIRSTINAAIKQTGTRQRPIRSLLPRVSGTGAAVGKSGGVSGLMRLERLEEALARGEPLARKNRKAKGLNLPSPEAALSVPFYPFHFAGPHPDSDPCSVLFAPWLVAAKLSPT